MRGSVGDGSGPPPPSGKFKIVTTENMTGTPPPPFFRRKKNLDPPVKLNYYLTVFGAICDKRLFRYLLLIEVVY